MSAIQNYNRQIANRLLKSQLDEIHRENIITGGGSYRSDSNPIPITNNHEPSFETPTSALTHQSGGKLKIPKFLRTLGHEAQTIGAPIVRKGATKLANALVDKGVNYLINGPPVAAAGIKKRGRPRKKKSSSFEHEEHCEHYKGPKGGKFNFVKTMNKIASNPIVKKIGNKVLDKAIDYAPQMAMMAMGAGVKKKRQPSNRNLLIKQIMQKEHCSLAEASKYIKSHNLKY
jgi:hypothetical protein